MLRLCMVAMRQHALRRIDERRFQGQQALLKAQFEEAQLEREAEVESRWHGMLQKLAEVHEDLRRSQLEAAQQAYEAQQQALEGALRCCEAELDVADARREEESRAQRHAMLVVVGCLLARRRLVLADEEEGSRSPPYTPLDRAGR